MFRVNFLAAAIVVAACPAHAQPGAAVVLLDLELVGDTRADVRGRHRPVRPEHLLPGLAERPAALGQGERPGLVQLLLLGLLSAPAGAAHRLTATPYRGLLLSAVFAVASIWIGLTLSYVFPTLPPSSMIIAAAVGIYVLALPARVT